MNAIHLAALTNRSIRNIRNELEFLVETDCITQTTLEAILSRLPANITTTPPTAPPTPAAGPVPHTSTPAIPHPTFSPPPSAKTPISEKYLSSGAPAPSPVPQAQHPQVQPSLAPPPSYTPTALVISLATARWAFAGTESGDLIFAAGDTIEVLEKIKDDWWKGRVAGGDSFIGLFPSSYVAETRVLATGNDNEKGKAVPSLPPRTGYGHGGNMMTDIAHSEGGEKKQGAAGALGKGGEKFGKKLGNAAIFGAGATMGSKLVNGIF